MSAPRSLAGGDAAAIAAYTAAEQGSEALLRAQLRTGQHYLSPAEFVATARRLGMAVADLRR